MQTGETKEEMAQERCQPTGRGGKWLKEGVRFADIHRRTLEGDDCHCSHLCTVFMAWNYFHVSGFLLGGRKPFLLNAEPGFAFYLFWGLFSLSLGQPELKQHAKGRASTPLVLLGKRNVLNGLHTQNVSQSHI